MSSKIKELLCVVLGALEDIAEELDIDLDELIGEDMDSDDEEELPPAKRERGALKASTARLSGNSTSR